MDRVNTEQDPMCESMFSKVLSKYVEGKNKGNSIWESNGKSDTEIYRKYAKHSRPPDRSVRHVFYGMRSKTGLEPLVN